MLSLSRGGLKNLIGLISNPIALTSIRLREALEGVIKPLASSGLSCLDVGCGDRPYEYLFGAEKYLGIDIEESGRPCDMKAPDYFYNGLNIPFADDEFDMVLCTQVLEHVPDPLMLLNEMVRVCKPEGSLIISLPFTYPEHEQPFDYFRFTRFGIGELLHKAGMRVETIKQDSSSIETLAILTNLYIASSLIPNIRGMGRIYTALLCFPIQAIALILTKLLPDNGFCYLNLVIHARKI